MASVDAIFDRAVNEKSNPILVDPKGKQHGKIDPHPLNSQLEISRKLCFKYDIAYNNRPSFTLCHVVYATLGLTRPDTNKAPK